VSNIKYTVTKELKSSIKINKFLELNDILFMASYVMFFSIFKMFIFSSLQTVFVVFNIIIAIILSVKSPFNRGKRLYYSLFLFVRNNINDNTYISVNNRGALNNE